jgi:hypothetical protein
MTLKKIQNNDFATRGEDMLMPCDVSDGVVSPFNQDIW